MTQAKAVIVANLALAVQRLAAALAEVSKLPTLAERDACHEDAIRLSLKWTLDMLRKAQGGL